MPDLFLVACLAVAAGALAYPGVVAIRWANRRHARQTTTEPVSPTATATRAWGVLLPVLRWLHGLRRDYAQWETGGWRPGELLAVATAPLPPEPPIADEGDYIAEFLARMDSATGEFRKHVVKAQDRADRGCTRALMTYDPEGAMTGSFDRAELDALMEGAGA